MESEIADNIESMRSLSFSCNNIVTPRQSNVSEYSVASPGRFSPTSPHARSPWNNVFHLKLSQSEFQSRENTSMGYPGNSYGCITSMCKRDGHIFSIAVANGLLYAASESKSIRVWRCPDFVEYGRFKSGSGTVRVLLVTRDQIFSAHQDHKIRVWRRSRSNPSVHRRAATLPTFRDNLHNFIKPRNCASKHTDIVSSLAYNAADGLLYSGSWDKTVKVWKMADLKCIETIRAHKDVINAVALGQDGSLFTGSDDSTLKVWRRALGGWTHTLITTLQMQFSPVRALAISPDGRVVYAGCTDGYINYWEKAQLSDQMHHMGFLRGHRHAVLCLTTMENLVFSGSADATIRVWTREMGSAVQYSCLAVLEGHMGPVKCIAASIDDVNGCLVYSGSLDGIVKVWCVGVRNKLEPANDDQEYFELSKA